MNKKIEQSTFIIAPLLLLSAIASTLMLASIKLGFVDEIPGCGPQSGCDIVTNTVWGYVPLINIPISFVGVESNAPSPIPNLLSLFIVFILI